VEEPKDAKEEAEPKREAKEAPEKELKITPDQPEPQNADKKPVEAAVKKPKKKFNKITYLIIAAALIILGAVGYGLYNGNNISNYAKNIKAIMVESNIKWTQAKIDQSNMTTDEMYETMQVIKADSNAQLDKLNKLEAPSKAKNLESKTREYFSIAGEASTNILALLDYIKALQASADDLRSIGGNTNSVAEFVTLFTEMHTSLTANIAALEAANPPAAYDEFNDAYIATLDKMDVAIVKAIGYAQSNQMNLMTNVLTDIQTAMNDMNQLSPPNDSEVMAAILTEAKKAKLTNYPSIIKTDADRLAKTVFSF